MSKKALIITTVSGFVPQFEMNNVKIMQELGYEVHYASNYNMPHYGKDNSRLEGTGIIQHQVDFVRSPFKLRQNLRAFKQLRQLEKKEQFELVHCHTPMGGVLGRIVFGILGSKKTKIMYTAHGFHFFKGAPIKNWLSFYPVEKFLSKWTDLLITINKEDYERAKKAFHAKKVVYIPGVGVDVDKIAKVKVDTEVKRKEIGIDKDAILVLSVGELNLNKNHEIVIKALAKLQNEKIHYVIAGAGELEEKLRKLSKELNIENQVHLLGFRSDVLELNKVCDIFVFPSIREGLSVSLMEAMASGKPVVCSNIRGNRDLVNVNGGRLFETKDVKSVKSALQQLIQLSEEDLLEMGKFNLNFINKCSISVVEKLMIQEYKKLLR